MSSSITIRAMKESDLEAVATVHEKAFIRQKHNHEWIECNFRAYPVTLFFVAEESGAIAGFIYWTQKSGFRPQAVLELSQLAVHPDFQKRGVAKNLITQSLALVKEKLLERGATIKHVYVTTRTDNMAQHLYKKTLGAEPAAVIKDLFSFDEMFLIARNIDNAEI